MRILFNCIEEHSINTQRMPWEKESPSAPNRGCQWNGEQWRKKRWLPAWNMSKYSMTRNTIFFSNMLLYSGSPIFSYAIYFIDDLLKAKILLHCPHSGFTISNQKSVFATHNFNTHMKNCQTGLEFELLFSWNDRAVCLWHAHTDVQNLRGFIMVVELSFVLEKVSFF